MLVVEDITKKKQNNSLSSIYTLPMFKGGKYTEKDLKIQFLILFISDFFYYIPMNKEIHEAAHKYNMVFYIKV